MDMKYKDLTIIVGTLLLLILAVQYDDFSAIQSASQQTGQITQTVKQVAKRLDLRPGVVSINSTTQNANLMVKTPDGYYRVDYNADGTQFVLEKVELAATNHIKVQGVE